MGKTCQGLLLREKTMYSLANDTLTWCLIAALLDSHRGTLFFPQEGREVYDANTLFTWGTKQKIHYARKATSLLLPKTNKLKHEKRERGKEGIHVSVNEHKNMNVEEYFLLNIEQFASQNINISRSFWKAGFVHYISFSLFQSHKTVKFLSENKRFQKLGWQEEV